MSKKGYIFLETIIVLVVVMIIVTNLLVSYTSISNKANITKYYDTINEEYALRELFFIGVSIDDNYINSGILFFDNQELNDNDEYSTACDERNMGKYIDNCAEVLKSMNVVSIGIINDIEDKIKSTTYDKRLLMYLEYLNNNKESNSDKYVIGVFKKEDKYYFASLLIKG